MPVVVVAVAVVMVVVVWCRSTAVLVVVATGSIATVPFSRLRTVATVARITSRSSLPFSLFDIFETLTNFEKELNVVVFARSFHWTSFRFVGQTVH